MSVCVQPVELPGGDKTWTVLGADHRPVGSVEEFLEYHRITGSSPHTVRGYAKGLQLWWRYLELDDRDWAGADVPALAGFVTWLRQGTPPGVVLLDPAAAAPPRLAESTLATRLAAVVSFYRYHHDAHGIPAQPGADAAQAAGGLPAADPGAGHGDLVGVRDAGRGQRRMVRVAAQPAAVRRAGRVRDAPG